MTKQFSYQLLLVFFFCINVFSSQATCTYAQDVEVKELQIGNMIQWVTTEEQNNEYFAVMRSFNGVEFEMIGKVMGAGNSSEAVKYQYLDIQPGQNRSFYKLQQLDFDGSENESHTFVLNRQTSNNFIIHNMSSTITNDYIQIHIVSNQTDNASYEVQDLTNETWIKETLRFTEGENTFTVNVSNLKNANYTLNLKMGEEVEEIMIQKVPESQLPSIRYVLAKEE